MDFFQVIIFCHEYLSQSNTNKWDQKLNLWLHLLKRYILITCKAKELVPCQSQIKDYIIKSPIDVNELLQVLFFSFFLFVRPDTSAYCWAGVICNATSHSKIQIINFIFFNIQGQAKLFLILDIVLCPATWYSEAKYLGGIIKCYYGSK